MAGRLRPQRFRVTSYRNIEDSGWIAFDKVTAFVGRNEAGKTALLKALHKFNPASPEPYQAQREFPRDRFTKDYKNGADWPVCSVEFIFSDELKSELEGQLPQVPLEKVMCTRYYDGSLEIAFSPKVEDSPLSPSSLVGALNKFAQAARRLATPPDQDDAEVQQLRTSASEWAIHKVDNHSQSSDLRGEHQALIALRDEANQWTRPYFADEVEALQTTVQALADEASLPSPLERLTDAVKNAMPVFIYFEDYGSLDSAVYLPRFLSDLSASPSDPKVRTINAMFKHVGLDATGIENLGVEEAAQAKRNGEPVTDEMIARDQEKKELRAVQLNSASLDITERFSRWFRQRRHQVRYHADGDYFRIWIADDRRPGVEIELESRSKGFQWFFSFYLVFLVESEEGHKDAILLLDEPGLHLHPTAQQDLISFFEVLAEDNLLLYTTHSPFLIDGEHIQRIRPVTEDGAGHSRVSNEGWPKDRETIFPLQAAAGYAMVRGLFRHKLNVLVEGMSDYLYLHTLNLLCRAAGRTALPEEIYITPCGGTKLVGQLAALFLGQEVRPLVLLDGDEAGRVRRTALLKELYAGKEEAVLLLSDVLQLDECEIEDVIGEQHILPFVADTIGKRIALNKEDRAKGSLPKQLASASARYDHPLPDGWKADVARRLATTWSITNPDSLPIEVLERAENLFEAIVQRLKQTV
jgi:predicted ATP-dependent endonuclease of OLD family